jgi:hypothetical protein
MGVVYLPDVLIRKVPEEILNKLKDRAKSKNTSLQKEILSVLEEAANYDINETVRVSENIRKKLSSEKFFSNSVDLIREDRER